MAREGQDENKKENLNQDENEYLDPTTAPTPTIYISFDAS